MKNYKKPKNKYLIDIRIITGLNATLDQRKIKKNCKLLEIDKPISSAKISKIDKTAYLTVGCSCCNKHYIQYEIKQNFNIKELYNISDDSIPFEIKSLILQAYELAQVNTLEELILID